MPVFFGKLLHFLVFSDTNPFIYGILAHYNVCISKLRDKGNCCIKNQEGTAQSPFIIVYCFLPVTCEKSIPPSYIRKLLFTPMHG